MAINRPTPKGTFPAVSAPQRSLRDALRTIGPYSPGAMTEREVMSPARQRDWALAQQQGANLKDILEQAMVARPRAQNVVRPALDAASNASKRFTAPELAAAQSAFSEEPNGARSTPVKSAAATAADSGPTNAASGIRGATMGRVNGKLVLIPAAGRGNREAYQTDVGMLGLDPSSVTDMNAVAFKQYQREKQRQFAVKGEEKRKLDNAIALQKVVNEGLIGKASAVANTRSEAQRAKEEQSLRAQLGKMRGGDFEQYQTAARQARINAIKNFRGDVLNTGKGENSKEFQAALDAEFVKAGLPKDLITDPNAYLASPYFQQHMRGYYDKSLGSTPGSEWKQKVFEEIMGFPLQEATPEAPPVPVAAAPPPAAPQPSATPRPTPGPPRPGVQAAQAPPPARPQAPPAQALPDVWAGMAGSMGGVRPGIQAAQDEAAEQVASQSDMGQRLDSNPKMQEFLASPPPEVYARYNEEPPPSPEEIASWSPAEAQHWAAALSEAASKLPPHLGQHFQQAAALAAARAQQGFRQMSAAQR